MIIKLISVKSILSKSKVLDYSLNPYIGCQHGCTYCYARFMKRYTKHSEEWGDFVDIKINAPTLLRHELMRKKPGKIWISGVCDPYQPVEAKYRLTRRCLEIILSHNWPVYIQTKSPLVLRDLDLIREFGDKIVVTLTITTADEEVRRIFEPNAPSIKARLNALKQLSEAGVNTRVMIAPVLPGAEKLIDAIDGLVNEVLIDRLNYHYADHIYRSHNMEEYMTSKYFNRMKIILSERLKAKNIPYQIFY